MNEFSSLPRGHKSIRGGEVSPDARWRDDTEISAMEYTSGAILLGCHGDKLIGTKDDRHLMTIAGSRAGKSSTCLKPNLKLWPSSVLCIDPKGELATETAQDRKDLGQDVYILDPFGEVKGNAAQHRQGFDPLSELTNGNPMNTVDDAAMIAEALVVEAGGDKGEHWILAARNLIRGLILYLVVNERETGTKASLPLLRYLITLPYEVTDGPDFSLALVLKKMSEITDYDGAISGVGGTMLGKPDNERGSIVSTAVEQTSFLDSPQMKDHFQADGLNTLRNLKRRPTTIYLVLPASRIATHNRWLRVILTMALAGMEREDMTLPHPVLFVLEEFPQLGYMRQIEAAAGLMAGYGVKLWTVLQDLTQIKALYKESWETFIGNAGVIQAFGNTDSTTTSYISQMLGTRLIKEQQNARMNVTGLASGAAMKTENNNTIPLLSPFEIALYGGRDTGMQFIMVAGLRPAYIKRLTHSEIESF